MHASTLGYENATPTELPRQRGPSPVLHKGRELMLTASNTAGKAPAPWGGPGRGFRRTGVWLLQAAVFVPAPAGLFLPPTAAFFTVVTAGVMQSMTVVMVPMPRRKTCFPIGIGDSTAKAKPPAVATAFCVYFIPFGDEQMKSHSGRSAISSNSVGVAISQPRVAGEARYPGYIYNKV